MARNRQEATPHGIVAKIEMLTGQQQEDLLEALRMCEDLVQTVVAQNTALKIKCALLEEMLAPEAKQQLSAARKRKR